MLGSPPGDFKSVLSNSTKTMLRMEGLPVRWNRQGVRLNCSDRILSQRDHHKKSSSSKPMLSRPTPLLQPCKSDSAALRDLLGYLNFSQGAVSARFRGTLNELFRDEQRAEVS
jgi:hypothetical protein